MESRQVEHVFVCQIMAKILLIQTGGTIDKDYPRNIGGYAFEICDAAAERILQRAKVSNDRFRVETVCRKDSQEINKADIELIVKTCKNASEQSIIITHGTDTILKTAEILASKLNPLMKTIILTGSMRPERMQDSDSDFNLGMAYGASQIIENHGIFVAIQGKLAKWDKFRRNLETGEFYVV